MNSLWIKVTVIACALAIGWCAYILTNNPDGPIEQAAESVLRSQGVDIDLSPDKD